MTNLPHYLRYKNPPIQERVITAVPSVRLSREEFLIRSEKWKVLVKEKFPHFVPQTDWRINIEQKDGGPPTFTSGGPEMEIRHWFWKQQSIPPKGLGLQSNVDKFSVNLVRDGDRVFSFEEAFSTFSEWLPLWATTFGAQKFGGFVLNYVNIINQQTVPNFVKNGRIEIGRILNIFSNIPVHSVSMVAPYDCQLNFLVEETIPCSARVHVRAILNGIQMDLQMSSIKEGKEVPITEFNKEIIILHHWIVSYFEGLFTQEAKVSFGTIQ